jgi:hypothetical protein
LAKKETGKFWNLVVGSLRRGRESPKLTRSLLELKKKIEGIRYTAYPIPSPSRKMQFEL